MPEISIVSPVYKGGATLAEFIRQILETLRETDRSFELILVDDGCPHDSWRVVSESCARDVEVKGIRLSRNYGQQIAASAGLRFAKGEKIIVLDSDLQNPIEAIPSVIEQLDNGMDIVYTISRVRNNWIDDATSSIFWFVVKGMLGVQIVPNQLMMKGFSRKFLTAFNGYRETVRVVAGIAHDIGMRSATLEVSNQRSRRGVGNHTFLQRLNLAIDILISLSSRPLNAIIYIGLFSGLGSFFMGVRTIIISLGSPNAVPGYASLLITVIFLGSMNLFVLGVLGRYITNIYTEVRERPLFNVLATSGFDDVE